MKKLYRKGCTIHPTPSVVSDHLLSFLPAAILALTVALSPSDKEVLAYLISCSSPSPTTTSASSSNSSSTRQRKRSDDHAPSFGCCCFACYMSYWVRWDTSPNRQLIDEIIDAYEDTLLKNKENRHSRNNGYNKRKGKKVKTNDGYLLKDGAAAAAAAAGELKKKKKKEVVSGEKMVVVLSKEAEDGYVPEEVADDVEEYLDVVAAEEEEEKGSVRRFVSFLGQSIWGGVWG